MTKTRQLLPRATPRRAITVSLLAVAICGCGAGSDPLGELRVLQEKEQFKETIAPLRALLDEDPNQPDASFLLGKALIKTGDSSAAVWPLRRAMESRDHTVEAGLMLGRAELSSRTPRDVLQAVEPVLALEPDNVEALVIRAQGYIKGSRQEDALADLARVIELDPENLEALVPRVVTLIQLERIDEAEEALAEAKRVIETTERPVRDALRGRLCAANALFAWEKGDQERSTSLHEECMEAHPTDRIVVGQAMAHFDRLNQRDRATEILRKAQEEADTPHFSSALARRLGRVGEPEERERLLLEEAEQRSTTRAWFALADFYVTEERFGEACDAFEQALAVEKTPAPMIIFAYVDTLIQAERYDDARQQLSKLEQEYMKNLLTGRLLLATGDAAGALSSFEAGLRLWPNNDVARFFAGQAAEQLGDFERAIEEYREAIRKRGDIGETDAALALARILVERGSPREAYPSLQRFLASHPGHEEAVVLAIRIGRQLKNAKLVAGAMERLMKMRRLDLAMAQQIGILSKDKGPEAAIAASDASGLDLTDPAHAVALHALIAQLALLGRHDEARERVAASLKQHPEAAAFHELAARALLAMGGDASQARAGFERALELEPERATALIGLAELAAAAGESEESLALYDRAVASDPDGPVSARALGSLLQGTQPSEERERRLAERVARNPRDALAANALAESLAARKADLDRALAQAERAAYFSAGPEAAVPEAKETLGWVHLQRGEHARAVEILQAEVDARPQATRARYRLGLALAASGDVERARKELEAVIASEGAAEGEEARRELARLAQSAAS